MERAKKNHAGKYVNDIVVTDQVCVMEKATAVMSWKPPAPRTLVKGSNVVILVLWGILEGGAILKENVFRQEKN